MNPTHGQRPVRPVRHRLAKALRAALAPVAASSLALGGLTTWVTAGKAGSPARLSVTSGRVFLPYGDSTQSAAFFDITNSGGADDRLVEVTSAATGGEIELSRHRMVGRTAASRQSVSSLTVRAGGRLSMSPGGPAVTMRSGAGWRAGDLVPFTLRFERSGAIRTLAVVVRPGGPAS